MRLSVTRALSLVTSRPPGPLFTLDRRIGASDYRLSASDFIALRLWRHCRRQAAHIFAYIALMRQEASDTPRDALITLII